MQTKSLAALCSATLLSMSASAQVTSVDLSIYTRVGRSDLPEPTRTVPPLHSLLAQEASAVTYNKDTGTLFAVGDGGTSVVQVSKTGQLIDSMTLALDASKPQGTYFYDPEGLTYVGNGQFVMVEERFRQVDQFTYAPNTTLGAAGAQTVKLGTTIGNIGNIGIEGISYDPMTGGFVAVKEKQPEGVFQTTIDFVAHTASNGSAATVSSVNLFNPTLANLLDFADVYALSNLTSLNGHDDFSHLLLLSQESGKIVNIDRSGQVFSSLALVSDAGNPLSIVDQQHEGLTMDDNGILYVVSENGGGDSDHPQLWVYAPTPAPVPLPPAMVLLGSALGGLGLLPKRARLILCEATMLTAESKVHPSPVQFPLPARNHNRRDPIADEIGQGARFRHEAVDAEDQGQARDRNAGHYRERRGQGHEAGASHARGAFGREHRHPQQGELLAQCQIDIQGLGDEQSRHGQIDVGAVEIEGIAGRHHQSDHRAAAAETFKLVHQRHQCRLRRRGAEHRQQFVLDVGDETQNAETGQRRDATQHPQHEQ